MTIAQSFKASLLLMILLAMSLTALSQPIRWKDSPDITLVYRMTDAQALKLLKGKMSEKKKSQLCATPFATFAKTWDEKPSQGHFLLASLERDKVNFRYSPVIPFQVFLFKEYGVLTLQVVDAKGKIRSDAKVRLGHRPVLFNKASQTYTEDDWSEKTDHILTVKLDGFRAIFDLTKHLVRPSNWDEDNDNDDKPLFYSYLITDKIQYKPRETVRFKSYALSQGRRPLKDSLTVMLTGYFDRKYQRIKVGTIGSYHPGGFAGEVKLSDSLGMQLDNFYSIQLHDKYERIVATTYFSYKDYELKSVKLATKLLASTQYAPNSNQLEIKATDVNDLYLPGVQAEITVLCKRVLTAYADVLSLPDTLLRQRVDLSDTEPTLVDIPAKIFGATDCYYEAKVVLLTFDNQRLECNDAATFYHSNYDLGWQTKKDSIYFSFRQLGKETEVDAKLTYDGGKEWKSIRLPYREKFNQSISQYDINVPKYSHQSSFTSSSMSSMLLLDGRLERDSFNVRLSNPLGLDVSWSIYEGNQLLQKGSGKEIDFRQRGVNPNAIYYVELFFFMGKQERVYKRSFTPQPELLSVSTTLPERVYPGQKVSATLSINDIHGNPVKNADLTAFSVNRQLNYFVPDLPYYGSMPTGREQRSSYSMKKKEYLYTAPMDYDYWNRYARLDSLPYYQFAYPSTGQLFQHTVNTPDSTTQFAPYVMLDGKSVNIYVIEVNDIPVYFSWVNKPTDYSFLIHTPGKKQKVTLRLHDRALVLDSCSFQAGKKTILSMNLKHLPENVKTISLDIYKDNNGRHHFSSAEVDRYTSYICHLPVSRDSTATWLTQKEQSYPIYYSWSDQYRPDNVLVGPIAPGKSRYMNGVEYRHEGGFAYQFEDNVVYKYPEKCCPKFLDFSTSTDFKPLNDLYLTPAEYRRREAEWQNRNAWHPRSIYIAQPDKRINFRLPVEADSTGVSGLLFVDSASGKVHHPNLVIEGKRKYSAIPSGKFDVVLLYNNGKYLKRKQVNLQPHHYTEVNLCRVPLHEADSASTGWLALKTNNYMIGSTQQNNTFQIIQKRWGGENTVMGIVTDAKGEPIIGASILVKGTHEGTITNIDGRFLLCMDMPNTIQIQYIGYCTKEIRVSAITELNIIMEEDNQMLDEVVVVGYGSTRKASLMGAVSGMRQEKTPNTRVPIEELEDEEKVITREAEKKLYNELVQLNGLRRNFSDVGFWVPRLFTDKNGQAEINITFPDNITQWDAVVYAMNQKLQTGTYRQSIRSYKPLMAELNMPRFLTVGDQSDFAGMIRNYTGDKQIVGQTTFTIGNDTLLRNDISLEGAYNEKLPVQPLTTDSLRTSYLFTRNDGYRDGEERTIPVLPQGTELADGKLGILQQSVPVRLQAQEGEELHVNIMDTPLDVYSSVARELMNYQYLCNEQLASKLIGWLADKKLKTYRNMKFNGDKKVNEIIRRLLDNQNQSGLWAWWGCNENTSHWMSAHIMRALQMAKDAGYSVPMLPIQKLSINFADWEPYRGISLSDIETLHILSDLGVKQDYASSIKKFQEIIRKREQYEDSLARAVKNHRPLSYLKEKLLLWEIEQKWQLTTVTDSIRPYLKTDIIGNIYCDDGLHPHSWYADEMVNTTIAYRIVSADSALKEKKVPMQLYLLRTKSRGWNTYQAATATATVLDDLLNDSKEGDRLAGAVVLSGSQNHTQTKFPYVTTLAAGQSLTMEQKGTIPMMYDAYSIRRVTEKHAGDAFEVSSAFKEGDSLKAGIPVTLTVTLNVKREKAEYVMLEIPIPAGCSYDTKPHYSYRYGHEVHREYFKEKTAIFCEKLPVGIHTFEIQLLPRYSGKYTLNPAKVELMYFPTVNANNGLRKVEIQ